MPWWQRVKDITLHTDGVAHVVSFVGFNPSQYSNTPNYRRGFRDS